MYKILFIYIFSILFSNSDSLDVTVNALIDRSFNTGLCSSGGIVCNLRESIYTVMNNGGGTVFLNGYYSDKYYLEYGGIVLESINNTNIRIKGIPIDNQLPEIDLNHYYIYSKINIIFEDVEISHGHPPMNTLGYYFNDDDDDDYEYNDIEYVIIDSNGGSIRVENSIIVVNNSIISNCESDYGYGAGIAMINSSAYIHNSEFYQNVVMEGDDDDGGGGALYFEGINNTLEISNSVFQNNIGKKGGAIYIKNTNNSYISHTNFSSNIANHKGGAIAIEKGKLFIEKSNFTQNYGQDGGVIHMSGGCNVSIELDNQIVMNGAIHGGGIYNDNSYLYVENTNFSENSASLLAGAIYNNGALTLIGCLFDDNESPDNISDNIQSVAEYYYSIILMSNIFNGTNNFAQGSLYASWKMCSSIANTSSYVCPLNTTCLDESIGFKCVCSKGTFQNGLYKDIICTDCPIGYYCPDSATETPIECPIGAYCNKISPNVCPVGYYCPHRNITEPIDCDIDENYRCPIGSIYKMSEEEGERYIEDIVLSESKYVCDKDAISYDDYTNTNLSNWNTQVSIIFYSFIGICLYWLFMTYCIRKYKFGFSYIKKLKKIDLFSMNHYHKIGVPIKKKENDVRWNNYFILFCIYIFCILVLYFKI